MLGALVAAGLAAGLLATRLADGRPVRPAAAPPAPPAWGLAGVIAVLACAALAAAWMVPTLGTLAAGMDRADSLWYHMPFAARFVQTGYLGHIYFFDPIFLASFYPANAEVLHAVPILFTGRDSVSPVLNLGWLSVALLAAWCIGRPYGVGPQALIGASVALGSQSLVEFQAGEALNDITGVALILAAVALLVNGYAAGQERSVKRRYRYQGGVRPGAQSLPGPWPLRGSRPGSRRERSSPSWRRSPPSRSRSSPSPPGRRACAPRPLGDPDAGRGRLLVPAQPDRGRQPDPVRRLARPDLAAGPGSRLPASARFRRRPLLERHRGVAGLVRARPRRLVRDPLAPDPGGGGRGRRGGALAGARADPAGAGRLGGRDRDRLRVHAADRRGRGGAADLIRLERSLSGPRRGRRPGDPAVPAGAAGDAAPPGGRARGARRCCSRSRSPRWCSGSRATPRARWRRPPWWSPAPRCSGRCARAPCSAQPPPGASGRRWRRPPSGPPWRPATPSRTTTSTHRYENTGQVQDLDDALRWSRDVRDARIAVAGIRGVFTQYPFYGTDLSNRVQWLGLRGPHDAYGRIPDCQRVAPGGQRGRLHPRRHHLRPLPAGSRCATRRRGAGRSPTPAPGSSCGTAP